MPRSFMADAGFATIWERFIAAVLSILRVTIPPLATVVIGGIVTSTFLTLVLLPTLYEWLEKRAGNTEAGTVIAPEVKSGKDEQYANT